MLNNPPSWASSGLVEPRGAQNKLHTAAVLPPFQLPALAVASLASGTAGDVRRIPVVRPRNLYRSGKKSGPPLLRLCCGQTGRSLAPRLGSHLDRSRYSLVSCCRRRVCLLLLLLLAVLKHLPSVSPWTRAHFLSSSTGSLPRPCPVGTAWPSAAARRLDLRGRTVAPRCEKEKITWQSCQMPLGVCCLQEALTLVDSSCSPAWCLGHPGLR